MNETNSLTWTIFTSKGLSRKGCTSKGSTNKGLKFNKKGTELPRCLEMLFSSYLANFLSAVATEPIAADCQEGDCNRSREQDQPTDEGEWVCVLSAE